MAKPLTKEMSEALFTQGCENPLCDHKDHDSLVLHSRCHVGKPVWVRAHKGKDFVEVICAECGKQIVDIKLVSEKIVELARKLEKTAAELSTPGMASQDKLGNYVEMAQALTRKILEDPKSVSLN